MFSPHLSSASPLRRAAACDWTAVGPVRELHLSPAANGVPALSVEEQPAELQYNNVHCVDSTQVCGLFPSMFRPIYSSDTGPLFTQSLPLHNIRQNYHSATGQNQACDILNI